MTRRSALMAATAAAAMGIGAPANAATAPAPTPMLGPAPKLPRHKVQLGRPAFRPYARADRGKRSRHRWHPGELYPCVDFIVTNLSRPADRVVAFRDVRTMDHGKGRDQWTRLSCRIKTPRPLPHDKAATSSLDAAVKERAICPEPSSRGKP